MFCSLLTRCTVPGTWHTKDIWTSKSGPTCCVLTFWLGNVLRATTACTFSTSQLLSMLRSWSVWYILNWICASHHKGVQLFISHLARWLRTGRFTLEKNTVFENFSTFSRSCIFFLLTFFWLSLLSSSFFWLFLPSFFSSLLLLDFLFWISSLTFAISAFHLSKFSEVWVLNFFRVLRTTKLARSTCPYYFMLIALHKARPSTTLFLILKSLQTTPPSTTLYCKICPKYLPELLRTTKFAQNNYQEHFVQQDMCKYGYLELYLTKSRGGWPTLSPDFFGRLPFIFGECCPGNPACTVHFRTVLHLGHPLRCDLGTYFLQHHEHWVNTSVFVRCCQKHCKCKQMCFCYQT